MSVDLRELGQIIYRETCNKFPNKSQAIMQTLCVAEEAGEFVGATRRYLGMARRSGTYGDMAAELADVVIAANVAAVALGIDLVSAVDEKAEKILTRGWKEEV